MRTVKQIMLLKNSIQKRLVEYLNVLDKSSLGYEVNKDLSYRYEIYRSGPKKGQIKPGEELKKQDWINTDIKRYAEGLQEIMKWEFGIPECVLKRMLYADDGSVHGSIHAFLINRNEKSTIRVLNYLTEQIAADYIEKGLELHKYRSKEYLKKYVN